MRFSIIDKNRAIYHNGMLESLSSSWLLTPHLGLKVILLIIVYIGLKHETCNQT